MAGTRDAGGGRTREPIEGMVDRPALVERLDRAMGKRLVRLVAPAGYGKSVLLRQWQTSHPDRRVVWTTARAADDAVRFGRRLLRALDVLAPGVQERGTGQLGLDGLALGEGLQEVVLAELAAAAPVTLVVEDLENLTSPELLEELGQMAESAAAGVCLVLVSRDDHLPATPRLRLRDEVVEIRQDALALSAEETGAAVGLVADVALSPAQIQALHERTEGWPAGVRLAALGVRDHPDPKAFIEAFAGDDRHVADYLSGEVLAAQPPEVRDFLIRTSVLRNLTGGLCDALTGRDDGRPMLARLEAASLFIQPHDDRRRWYSYHPLFRDLLRYELLATRPSDEHALLQRAAAWHLEHGDTDEAAEYLLADEDWPAIVALAKAVGGAYFEQGRATTVLGWMAQVPTEFLASGPDVVLAMVALHTMCGTAIAGEALLSRFESVARFDEAGQAFAAAARASWISYHSPPEVAEAAGERALRLLDAGVDFADGPVLGVFTPTATRALATLGLARARVERADLDGARELLTAVERSPGSPVWLVHALGERAWIEVSTGNLRAAFAAARRSLKVAADIGLEEHAAVAVAHLALARTMAEQGETTEADAHLQLGIARGRLNNRDAVLSLAFGEQAHAALVGGRAAEGLDRLRRARAQGRPPLLPAAEARLVALEARLHLLTGNGDAASAVLGGHDGLVTAELLGARASVASALGDTEGLRNIVDEWSAVDEAELTSRLRRGLWTAVLHDIDGDRRAALAVLGPVVLAAEAERWGRLFLDAGAEVLRLVRALYHAHPTPFLRVLAQEVVPLTRSTVTVLVEQLSEREAVVLAYLPSRLSNAEIATRLYVSVNTLKTHLKNIYRKLEVTSRTEAIERAEALGLL